MSNLHIGKQIKARIETQGMSKSEFARRINTTPQNVFGIFKRQSIDTNLLKRVSEVLDYDFFQYYHIEEHHSLKAHEPEAVYKTTGNERLSACEERLEQALKEVAYLKKINELLEKNSGKKKK